MVSKITHKEKDLVLCYHGPLIYEAKAEYWEGRPDLPDGPYYFVHYKGWKTTWDEWVPQERVMPITPETQALQQDLIKQVKENKQKAAPIQKIADPSTIKENKRRRDSLMDKEGSYLKKPEVKISVPESLKSQLVQDWENITKNQKLISLPAETPVTKILDDFYVSYKGAAKSTDDAMEQVVSGLKLYFDKALGNILLYRFERQQYVELMERHPEKKKSEIYGVEHLLRLFGTVLLISSIA